MSRERFGAYCAVIIGCILVGVYWTPICDFWVAHGPFASSYAADAAQKKAEEDAARIKRDNWLDEQDKEALKRMDDEQAQEDAEQASKTVPKEMQAYWPDVATGCDHGNRLYRPWASGSAVTVVRQDPTCPRQ